MADERDEFPAFPFEPYPIQIQLMKTLYAALHKGGVAIVESPTGTGKTLSLICSVLQWLEDKKQNTGININSEEPDWMQSFSISNKPSPRRTALLKKHIIFGNEVHHTGKPLKNSSVNSNEDDAEFLLDAYESDVDSSVKRKQHMISSDEEDSDEEEEDEVGIKVFFCSRTHSQLSQFIGELKRTKFANSMQVIALGSRKTLCINQDVLKLGNASRINDRCLELQQKNATQKVGEKAIKKVKTTGCCYLNKRSLQRQFKEQVLASEPMDIEDLVGLGQELCTCPYYGSRGVMRRSEVVVVPYQTLLHAPTREALGLNLKDSVVIFDEAHNLVDTVTNTYSFQLYGTQLSQVNSHLTHYLARFKSRLAPANRRYIQTLLVLTEVLLQRLSTTKDAEITSINDFVFSLEIDNINLFRLCRFIKESHIVNKVSSYGDKYLTDSTKGGFYAFADFIMALTTAQTDGRILLTSDSKFNGVLKFLMLDAAKHFSEVVNQAQAVVLAGGTLQPLTELRDRLLFQVADERVHIFSCGHIVPGENILPLAISKGPSGKVFEFNYQSRSSPEMIEELGRLLVNVSSIVPEGMVVFFPSFEYESTVYTAWESTGILASVQKKKRIFREPRSSSGVEGVLEEYRKSITHGSVMFCVVGGKMSEGINFADGMGRCVVMVGLPYPSPSDPELIEKIKYVEDMYRKRLKRGGCEAISASQKGKEYYEDLCMKAVNQSIGRAIRHVKDYAAILLIDVRYTREQSDRNPASKLPGWIKERLLVVKGGFGEVHKHLHQFFKNNKVKYS